MNRRQFVYSMVTGPGAVAIVGASAIPASAMASETTAGAAPPAVPAAAPLEVMPLHPTPAGESVDANLQLAGGFRVVATYAVFHGALPFVLEGEGTRFQIDVLRPGSGARGVFTTGNFDLFVHGAGGPTQERGARALGLALERQLRAGAQLPELATYEEREAVSTSERRDVISEHERVSSHAV
jgi:hypothetical protein